MRPDGEPEEPEEPNAPAGNSEPGATKEPQHNEPAPSHPDSPLDDLFIVGAKYHEPSAAEREAAAKAAERASKKAAKANEKEIERTRRVLEGGGDKGRHRRQRDDEFNTSHVERRTALLGFLGLVMLSVALSFTAFGH